WGTFGILIPIITAICQSIAPELMIISLSATLAGSVFGDHCSPISDTTILSSTGAGCDHIVHVTTQMAYCMVVAACCLVGYLIAGFTQNLLLTLGVSIAMLIIVLKVLHTRSEREKE
ncbi:MAG: Na+/H+ antiporter NhaC family protein, partial [Angelakisella sp.]